MQQAPEVWAKSLARLICPELVANLKLSERQKTCFISARRRIFLEYTLLWAERQSLTTRLRDVRFLSFENQRAFQWQIYQNESNMSCCPETILFIPCIKNFITWNLKMCFCQFPLEHPTLWLSAPKSHWTFLKKSGITHGFYANFAFSEVKTYY